MGTKMAKLGNSLNTEDTSSVSLPAAMYDVENGCIFRFESAKILHDLMNPINNKN
jgi:hypothetical protein